MQHLSGDLLNYVSTSHTIASTINRRLFPIATPAAILDAHHLCLYAHRARPSSSHATHAMHRRAGLAVLFCAGTRCVRATAYATGAHCAITDEIGVPSAVVRLNRGVAVHDWTVAAAVVEGRADTKIPLPGRRSRSRRTTRSRYTRAQSCRAGWSTHHG